MPSRLKITFLLLVATLAIAAAAQGGNAAKRSYDAAARLAREGNTAQSVLVLNRITDSLGAVRKSRTDSLLLADALKLNAKNHSNLGDTDKALRLYKSALVLARELGDKRREAALCGDLAMMCNAAQRYDDATELLSQALKLNMELGDTLNVRNNLNNLGLIAYGQRNYRVALQHMDKALALTPATDRLGRSLVLTNKAEVYYSQQSYGKAEAELNQALALQRGLPFDAKMLQTMLNMAYIKALLGKPAEAKRLVGDVGGHLGGAPVQMRSNAYRQLVDISFALGDSIEGLRNLLKYEELGDSVWNDNSDAQLRQLLVAYDADRLQRSNDTLEASVEAYRTIVRQRTTIIAIVAALVLLLALLAALLWRKMQSDRRNHQLINSQRDRLLEYEKQEHERKQREMAHELDGKTRQLTTYTIDLAAINDFHLKLCDQLRDLRDEMGKNPQAAQATARLNDMMQSVRHYNDKPVADDFRVYFDEVHPDFLSHLAQLYPALSKTDLRLCAYLLLGMTTKEISALTYREVRSVESSRYRLRKKLGVPADVDLHDFLMSLRG